MNTNSSSLNPFDPYYARMRELAERDPQIKALVPKSEIQDATMRPGLSSAEIMDIVLKGYANRPALGERRYDIDPDPETGCATRRYLPAFDAITYRELRERIEAVASAWRHHPKCRVNVDDFVCTVGSTGIDFSTVDLALYYAQAVSVPLQATLGAEHLQAIFKDTAPAAVFVTINDLALIAKLVIQHDGIHSLVAIDYDPRVDAERESFEAAQAEIKRTNAAVSLTTIQALIDFGKTHRWQPLQPHPQGLERMVVLLHSSGSTGVPKGVMIPERSMNLGWLGVGGPQMPTVTTAYQPMNHLGGRQQIHTTLICGGTAYCTANPDLSTLFEDIQLSRPTSLFCFPRIFELIYQHYKNEVVRRTGARRNEADVDAEVRAEMRGNFLGDRLLIVLFGSAPTSPEIKTFMRECFDITLIEGYGLTECGMIATLLNRVVRHFVIDYKLRDVPELGYYSTDKPYPRGELLIKSKQQATGYFKRPEATAAVFGEDGYVATGDIMEEREPDHIVYIDRRNDVLKLSHAEFVAVGPLGATFEGGSAAMNQVYIYGNSARAYLLAVVVPDMDVVAARIGPNPDEAGLKTFLRAEMQEVARTHKLRTFELPRDFLIEREPFSVENGLLTGSARKRSRPKLKAKYGERLEALYVEIERKRQEEISPLKDPQSPLTVLKKVVKVLEASLGVDSIDPDTSLSFNELGGDSLGTVSFSMFIEDIFGVELPVNAIVSPVGNPQRWAQQIEALLGTGDAATTCTAIHGKDARVLHARDLAIERFLDAQTLDNMPTEPPPAETRTILLTGANGFLGRFLCLGWMEQLAPAGGKVICLIRAANNSAARKRLDEVFEGVDAELEQHYRTLAEKHLEVIAADVAEPRFGLPQQEWERLANEVDHIVHSAALVNHVMAYEHLFGPNVFGTAELIRLALAHRQKRYDFVSSLTASLLTDTSADNSEDSPLLSSVTFGDNYAAGYGASKWASEVLLHDAHRRFDLPVNIFRGDMILPHRRYKGQINVPDMITRLFYSIIMTGLAPESFYEREPDGKRTRAHYDGMPVDFLASTILGIGIQAHREIKTFHTTNHHHDDGVSLDSFIDWIQSAGYAVERVRDHGEWMKRLEAKLGTLTKDQRQHSSVAILDLFRSPFPRHEVASKSEHYSAAVRTLAVGPEIPHLSEAFIHKYLDDMHRLRLISEVGSDMV